MVDEVQVDLSGVESSVVSLWAVREKARESQISMIGCGVIVDSRGYVLTTVIPTPDIDSLYVLDRQDNKYAAEIVTTDEKLRVTLLKVDPGDRVAGVALGLKTPALGDSEQLDRGEGVVAVGARMVPGSWELATTTGRITKQRQTLVVDGVKYRDLIQTDVLLTSEHAGGPLVNQDGEVIGLALPFVRPPGGSELTYALPINHARNFIRALPIPQWSDGPSGEVCSWLGAETIPLNPVMAAGLSIPHRRGEVVNHILNNSAVERAGLRRGDVITSINGETIADRSSFDRIAPQLCQVSDIELSVLRDGQQQNMTVYWDKAAYVQGSRGGLAEVVLVVLIFSLMYFFVYRNIFDRVILFVLGAIVVAITGHHLGFYEQDQMAEALLTKLDVLCFIVGMHLVCGVLEEAGGLEYLAKKITLATGGDRWRIMALFCVLTYAMSLVVNNLTTIMLMAPMVLKLSKYLDCDAKPFLISMVIASNLGGASTMVGDFPNMLIGSEVGLPFKSFILYMLPICLLELLVLLVFLRLTRSRFFRSAGSARNPLLEGASHRSSQPDEYQDCHLYITDYPELTDGGNGNGKHFFAAIRESLPKAITNRKALRRGLIILAGVTVGFLLSDSLNCPAPIVALVGGIVALAFGACNPFSLMQKVSMKDILFFSGLFILVGAAEAAGALNYISQFIVHLSFGNVLVLTLLLMWAAAFVTCFLNAGPATALFLPVVLSFKSAAPHHLYWWALSLGVCAGSSGTLAGATAGSVTSTMFDKFIKGKEPGLDASPMPTDTKGEKYGKLTFREFAKLGLPMMLIFLLMSSIYISVLYHL